MFFNSLVELADKSVVIYHAYGGNVENIVFYIDVLKGIFERHH